MRSRKIDVRTKRNDSKGVDGWMAAIIMPLDVFHVDCTTHARNLEYVFGIIEQIRELAQQFLVTLEVNRIHLQYSEFNFLSHNFDKESYKPNKINT
ncbi:hypothetical protein Vadar_024248 [Vaccinium darrowii]|uniref:Uncharacterized protein n=1 Tax=Vaccinium darrowii TaxID=229202 RepID=A0ACB7XC17_9ERIC|nr:hypothetical protein Vadar_024248 [Vaccinium darrowii]